MIYLIIPNFLNIFNHALMGHAIHTFVHDWKGDDGACYITKKINEINPYDGITAIYGVHT